MKNARYRHRFSYLTTLLVGLALWPAFAARTLPGDIDGNGRVDATDIQLIINASLGRIVLLNCDVNGSGHVDAMDLQLTVNAALGLPMGVSVPDVVGLTYDEARTTIASVGLTIETAAQVYSGIVPAGYVMSVNPAVGAYQRPGTGLDLVVSNGTLPASGYAFDWALPDIYQPWYFTFPTVVAAGPDGSVYVADTTDRFSPPSRILKFSTSGVLEAQWGSEGSGPGQFERISAIAVGRDGSVYVASGHQDFGVFNLNPRIQKFTAFGVFVTQFSDEMPNRLTAPVSGLAVGPDGSVYAADRGGRILKFTSSGTSVTHWHTYISGDIYFMQNFYRVAVGPDGSVYVMDLMNLLIQQFTSSGQFVAQWGTEGSGDSQFWGISDLSVGPDGAVYVVSGSQEPLFIDAVPRVQKFTPSGGFVAQWGFQGKGDGQFVNPLGIAVGSDGAVYVADTWNKRIQQFTASGAFVRKWGAIGANEGEFASPYGVAVGLDGTFYVADSDNNRIQHFTATGEFLGQWGERGPGDGQFEVPHDVAVDDDNSVYVIDSKARIQQFTASGVFTAQWKPADAPDSYNHVRYDVAVGQDGSVYLADGSRCVMRFTAPGGPGEVWGAMGRGEGEFYYPLGIAAGPDGSIYVADTGNSRIQRFTATGGFVAQWGTAGPGDGQFDYPIGVAVSSDGSVFVADEHNHRIQHFTASGVLLERWGLQGHGGGQFLYPVDVAVGPDGVVYVADTDNNRIQKFVPVK